MLAWLRAVIGYFRESRESYDFSEQNRGAQAEAFGANAEEAWIDDFIEEDRAVPPEMCSCCATREAAPGRDMCSECEAMDRPV